MENSIFIAIAPMAEHLTACPPFGNAKPFEWQLYYGQENNLIFIQCSKKKCCKKYKKPGKKKCKHCPKKK